MKVRRSFDRVISSIKSKSNPVLMVIVLLIIITSIESTIGYIADFIPEMLSSFYGVLFYVGMTLFSVFGSFYMIGYIQRLANSTKGGRYANFKPIFYVVFVAQSLITAVLIFVIIQILAFQEYNIITLYIVHTISYGTWIGIMGLLARAFILWYKNFSHNNLTLIFAIAMIAYVVNGIIGFIGYIDYLIQQDPIIFSDYIAYFPEYSNTSMIFQAIGWGNTIASMIAYIFTWIGSVKLLYQSIRRIGSLTFWSLMIISMVYYNLSYFLFVLGFFSPDDNSNALLNILIFTIGTAASGIIFGVSFLSIARTLRKDSIVKTQLILTAYGFILFYVTGSASAAQAAYPPYGLISISLIGLSCYLIYSGLLSSVQTVSQDNVLLRSIRKLVTEQANFLGSIGTAQRNKELESRVLRVAKNLEAEIEEASGVETSLNETEMVDYIQYVMKEIHGSKKTTQ